MKEKDTSIYSIIMVQFDSLENHLSNAICEKNLGYVVGKKEAKEIIEELNKEFGYTYDGWDKEKYPYYKKEKLAPFTKNKLNKYGYLK